MRGESEVKNETWGKGDGTRTAWGRQKGIGWGDSRGQERDKWGSGAPRERGAGGGDKNSEEGGGSTLSLDASPVPGTERLRRKRKEKGAEGKGTLHQREVCAGSGKGTWLPPPAGRGAAVQAGGWGCGVVPRPGGGLWGRGGGGGGGHGRAPRGAAQQLPPADALLPIPLPRGLCGHTGPSRHVHERNTRITNCPRVQRLLRLTLQVLNGNKSRKRLPRGRKK